MPLGKHGFVSSRLHRTHNTNLTPHTAIGVYYVVLLGFVFILHAAGASVLTMFGDAGTLAAFGFLFAYYMITIAAPFYLRKLGELKRSSVWLAGAGCLCLLVPLVGSFYPVPPWPVNIFPALFVIYMIGGGVWLYALNRRSPRTLSAIEHSLETSLQESVAPASDSEQGGRIGLAIPAIQGAAGAA